MLLKTPKQRPVPKACKIDLIVHHSLDINCPVYNFKGEGDLKLKWQVKEMFHETNELWSHRHARKNCKIDLIVHYSLECVLYHLLIIVCSAIWIVSHCPPDCCITPDLLNENIDFL